MFARKSFEVGGRFAYHLLYAFRQLGEISKGLEKASLGNQHTGKHGGDLVCPSNGQTKPKNVVLSDAGIDRRRAAEADNLIEKSLPFRRTEQ